jgi:hypothetical protein
MVPGWTETALTRCWNRRSTGPNEYALAGELAGLVEEHDLDRGKVLPIDRLCQQDRGHGAEAK